METKYPEVEVKLTETSGNSFAIIGAVSKALRRNDVSKEEIDTFQAEASSGNYDNVIQTAMRWVKVS